MDGCAGDAKVCGIPKSELQAENARALHLAPDEDENFKKCSKTVVPLRGGCILLNPRSTNISALSQTWNVFSKISLCNGLWNP